MYYDFKKLVKNQTTFPLVSVATTAISRESSLLRLKHRIAQNSFL